MWINHCLHVTDLSDTYSHTPIREWTSDFFGGPICRDRHSVLEVPRTPCQVVEQCSEESGHDGAIPRPVDCKSVHLPNGHFSSQASLLTLIFFLGLLKCLLFRFRSFSFFSIAWGQVALQLSFPRVLPPLLSHTSVSSPVEGG